MTRSAPARRPRKALHPDIPVPPALLIQRRQSGIHGHGVYARTAIPAGHVIVEYTGERITKTESLRREAARLGLERIRKLYRAPLLAERRIDGGMRQEILVADALRAKD